MYRFVAKCFFLLLCCAVSTEMAAQNTVGQLKDTTVVNTEIDTLKYPFKADQQGGLFLSTSSTTDVRYDAILQQYILAEKIGDYLVKSPVYMSLDDYKLYRFGNDNQDYFSEKISATNSKKEGSREAQKNLLPTYYVNSRFFETVFGGNSIEVNPQGSLLVKLGAFHQKVENPQLSERNRRSFNVDFDQQINASISANVGKRLKIQAQYDTQSTFSFQNQVKIEFIPPTLEEYIDRKDRANNQSSKKGLKEPFNKVKGASKDLKNKIQSISDGGDIIQELGIGDDDSILQKLEVGNVSMPLKNSLIQGAQSLFGAKTQLKFGNTTVTGVFAEQRSQMRSVASEGGATLQEFELKASDYDENRHFFLSHYFRDNYNKALQQFPLINSQVMITRVEVWITNRNTTTTDVRNIVALADLGEASPENIGPATVNPAAGSVFPANNANDLDNILSLDGPVRNIATVSNGLTVYSMQQGRDYTVLENAIKLSDNDYTIHPQLGFISLNRRLSDADVLAVSYEYTLNGSSEVYKVGELTTDGVVAPDNIVVKLLRGEILNTEIPLWDLMMKNIYSLQAFNMQPEGFRLELLYADDATGVPVNRLQNAQTNGVPERTILNLLSLDRLDQSQFATPEGDGYFDYVEGVTVLSEKGYVLFPTVAPFGEDLQATLTDNADETYLFNELYAGTRSEVKNNYQHKDKYLLKGYHKSENTSGIPLGAFNVPKGAVRVTSNGRELIEGVDYVVDYQMGRVQIVNPGLEASNAPIEVSVENNATFNLQTKRFIGLDLEHRFSDKLLAGLTFLNLHEKPLTQKALYGQEPFNNTIVGLNASYGTDLPWLTRLVNKIPTINTTAVSSISIRGDVAFLQPGSSKGINQEEEATSYVDDFEGSQIPLEIRSTQQWHLASTPQHQTSFDFGGNATDLSYGYQRAKLAWYTIDPLFYGSSSIKPGNINNSALSRAEVRRIRYEELFPQQDLDLMQSNILPTFDLAYFPHERGPYNFDTDQVDATGSFVNPEERWAGITRPMTTTDFEQANIEYIQFWLMDPYEHYSITHEEGLPVGLDPSNPSNQVGSLFVNLGNISEDLLKDGRKMYENGLPEDPLSTQTTDPSIWGKIPTNQSMVYAFGDSDSARLRQDVGFDGLNDDEELQQFGSGFGPDPASDNYRYFRSAQYDAENASILTRYKQYNNPQGNSPTNNLSPESYPTAATPYPDIEDIDKDQTMNAIESYFQYKVSLNKEDLVVGQNHIVDEKTAMVSLKDGTEKSFRWLQFRIPLSAPEEVINGISGFQSIRFMRMFLTDFKMPMVLRFGELQLVRGDWRRYTKTLDEAVVPPQPLNANQLQNFETGVVSIEENENRTPIPYVLPPGIEREVLRGNTRLQRQNEQSLSLKVSELPAGETRAVYKNVSVDLRMYKKLKLFLHAEAVQSKPAVQDGQLTAIVRLGSDLNDNYYQLEKSLVVSAAGAAMSSEVWPTENNLSAVLEHLAKLKLIRFDQGIAPNQLYPSLGTPSPIEGLEGYDIRVKGHPNLGNINTIMLGLKNVSGTSQSAEVWFNEMRVSDFDDQGGWAAVVTADANLADFADIAVTGSMQTQGFGGIAQRVNERSQENSKLYDLVTNVNVGRLLPEKWGVQAPLNFSISEEVRDPKYDPQYQDVLFDDARNTNPNSQQARDYTKRRSISLINVRKQSTDNRKKTRFYDLENFAVSYAYNEAYHRDYNVKKQLDQQVRASANYNVSFAPKSIKPFKNLDSLSDTYFKFIKDINFNLLPSSISVNSNITRRYSEQRSRTLVAGLPELPTLKQRHFLFDWDYAIGYQPTQSLQLTFNAANHHTYDQFEEEEIALFDKFFTIGRPAHYHQSLTAGYQLPLSKFPLLDFVKSEYTYTADFDWQAGSQSYIDQVGNVVQNANTSSLGVELDFKKFYRNIGLQRLFAKSRSLSSAKKRKKGKHLKFFQGKAAQSLYKLLTAVKKTKFNYTENNGTYLSGYLPEVGFLGRHSHGNTMAPTLGFVFGSQLDILQRAVENGWLVSRGENDPYYLKTYSQTHLSKMDLNLTVAPLKDLSIAFRGSKTYTSNNAQQIDVLNQDLLADSPVNEYGNFSMNYNLLGSTFTSNDANFDKFKANRAVIAARLAAASGQPISGFGSNSQQVMLPAFMAAYSGVDASTVSLTAFRKVPIPGWQFNYRGLMKMKWFKKHFRNFSISHGYQALYSITNYSNNLSYNPQDPYATTDIAGNFQQKHLFGNVNLVEEFSPLIKIDMKMKNSVSFMGSIHRDRGLTLNFNNHTITQIAGVEYVLGIGYRIKDLPIRLSIAGKKTRLKGDLTVKADVSLRDNQTVIRALDTDNDQVTGGQRLLSVKILAEYALRKNLSASFYFDQSASSYAISTTFPRQSVNAGISVRYILGNQ